MEDVGNLVATILDRLDAARKSGERPLRWQSLYQGFLDEACWCLRPLQMLPAYGLRQVEKAPIQRRLVLQQNRERRRSNNERLDLEILGLVLLF